MSQSGPDMRGGRLQLPGLTNRQSLPGCKKHPPALRDSWQPDPLVPASVGQCDKTGASFVPQRSDNLITATPAEWPGPAPHTSIGVEGSAHRTRSQSCMGWREETEFAELLERNPCLMLTQTFYDQRLRQDRRGAMEGSRASTSLSSSTTVMGGSRLSSRTGTALSTARTKASMSGDTSASSSAASRYECVRAQRGGVQACLHLVRIWT